MCCARLTALWAQNKWIFAWSIELEPSSPHCFIIFYPVLMGRPIISELFISRLLKKTYHSSCMIQWSCRKWCKVIPMFVEWLLQWCSYIWFILACCTELTQVRQFMDFEINERTLSIGRGDWTGLSMNSRNLDFTWRQNMSPACFWCAIGKNLKKRCTLGL